MTDRALGMFEVEAFDGTALTDILDDPLESPSDCEAPAFSRQGSSMYIATAKGFKSATGALTAISLEVAAAFCFYCIWQIWHMMR